MDELIDQLDKLFTKAESKYFQLCPHILEAFQEKMTSFFLENEEEGLEAFEQYCFEVCPDFELVTEALNIVSTLPNEDLEDMRLSVLISFLSSRTRYIREQALVNIEAMDFSDTGRVVSKVEEVLKQEKSKYFRDQLVNFLIKYR